MTNRRGRRGLYMALIVAGVIVLVGAIIACVLVSSRPGPGQRPVSQVQPWCVDPVTMQLLDDDLCEGDDDDHHVWFVPPHGVKKPAKGAILPTEARSAWSSRPSIPAQRSVPPGARPSVGPLVQLPGRSTPKPTPKRTR